EKLVAIDEGHADLRCEMMRFGGVSHRHEHRPLRLPRPLDAIQLADQLHSHAVAAPMLRLDDRRLPAADEHQVHAAVGPPAAAHLTDTVAVTAEGVGDDLLELLPAERGKVA